ncbi:MAG TPA: hypothetical protein VH416_08870 [Gaiellaceae bacterium]
MVAAKLVDFDHVWTGRVEPVGEALVQLGPDGFRKCVVGGVPDQLVAEAEGVVAGNLRFVRLNQLLAHERIQAHTELWFLVDEVFDSALVEHATRNRSALEHTTFGRVQLVETSSKERLDRRRHRELTNS